MHSPEKDSGKYVQRRQEGFGGKFLHNLIAMVQYPALFFDPAVPFLL